MSERTRTKFTARQRNVDVKLAADYNAGTQRGVLSVIIAGVETVVAYFNATSFTPQVALGAAADLVGFYGATPVAQPHATAQSAVDTTAITAVPTTAITTLVTTPTATDIATAVNSLIARVALLVTADNSLITQSAADVVLANRMRADLVSLGLIKGSN